MDFEKQLEYAAEFIREHDGLTMICHADADGICASAILHQVLKSLDKEFQALFVSQISSPAIRSFARKTEGPVIFVDTGSSHLDQIENAFKERPVLVLDHHQAESEPENIILANPFLCGLDGTRDICTSGMAFKIAEQTMETFEPLLPIALIGIQGDNQETAGYQGYNDEIYQAALETKLVQSEQGPRIFGKNTRKVIKLLQKSYDLKVPEIKSRYDAKVFLENIGIPPFADGKERWYSSLSLKEKLILSEELITRSNHPEPVIQHHTLPTMPKGPLQDTREAATVLNACGRLGKPGLGVKMLLGDVASAKLAIEIQHEYGQTIHKAHEWYRQADEDSVMDCGELLILKAGTEVPADLAGTICSVITRGREVGKEKIVVCLAQNKDGTMTTKVSSRALESPRDLAKMMKIVAEKVDGEGGGHAVAAGAVIPTDSEEAFLKELINFTKENK